MIKNIKVIDTSNRELAKVLPERHILNINNPLVLVVGENDSGKSAFLRLLNSSLLNSIFFDVHGYSKLFHIFGYDKLNINDNMVPEGVSKKEAGGVFTVYSNIRNNPERDEICWDMFQKLYPELAPEFSVEMRKGCLNVFLRKDRLERIRKEVKELSKRDTERNRWGYFRIETDRAAYPKGFAPSLEDVSLDPPRDIHSSVTRFLEYDPLVRFSSGSNPGTIISRLNRALERNVDEFFASDIFEEEYLEVERRRSVFGEKDPYKAHVVIKEGSDLILLLDEPTAFLSYKNKYKFRDIVLKLLDKYRDKLQIFIATNDPVIIEKAAPCAYLSFDESPATMTQGYSVSN